MFSYTNGAATDRGDIRLENQDSILCLTGRISGQAAALFAVADGMGGLSYGAEVGRYVIAQFERWWQEDFPQMFQDGMDRDEDIRELLEQEIWDINLAIYDFKNRMKCRAGSTLSLLLLCKQRYYIENIGDSRVYLLRDEKLRQMTNDQSLTAQMIRNHHITEEETAHSRGKNILTMCIGMFPVPQSEYVSGKLFPGDCFLLCSDGLYNPLDQMDMEKILSESGLEPQEKADRLRQMIGPGNAKDNVSAVVAEVRRERAAGK